MSNEQSDGSVSNGDSTIFGDLTGAGKVINSEVAKRTYDDALSGPMQQIGYFSTDILKSIRLFAMPFQLAASYQDRLTKFYGRVCEKVPEEAQQEAAPEIALPVLEALVSTSEDSPLMSMFEELMARAIDSREVDQPSPDFPALIKSLSPLGAKLIQSLWQEAQYSEDIYDGSTLVEHVSGNIDFDSFGGLAHHVTLCQELTAKGLATTKTKNINNPEGIDLQEGKKFRRMDHFLSLRGKWFAAACLPRKKEGE